MRPTHAQYGRYSTTMEVNGASRARTGDLLHAMQALSQLSYSPELVPRGPSVYRAAGCSWLERAGGIRRFGRRRVRSEASRPCRATGSMRRARRSRQAHTTDALPISAAPAGNGGHSDDVALECRPLALHPRQGTDQDEYEVAPSAFNGGYVNIDLELYRSGDDGRLGSRAFVI